MELILLCKLNWFHDKKKPIYLRKIEGLTGE